MGIFERGTASVPVEEYDAGVLMTPDGRPVHAVSIYDAPPADGRPLRSISDLAPEVGAVAVAVSYYDNGVLWTPDGRHVHAVTGVSALDESTTFLCRFNTATPIDEVSGIEAALFGDATVDTDNQQLVLDGTDDYITFTGVDGDLAAEWTIEFHFDDLATTGDGGLICRTDGVLEDAATWKIYKIGNAFHWYPQTSGTTSDPGGAMVADAGEHHCALTRDGATLRLYLDGVQIDSSTRTDHPTSGSHPLFIGTDRTNLGDRHLAGRLSRMKISNVCLYPDGTAFDPPARTDL